MSLNLTGVCFLITAFANAVLVWHSFGREWGWIVWSGWMTVALLLMFLQAYWYNRR